ncbi:hypothetical protein [Homoserinimonas hongtaonis]|uniref:hypothetical protein n=1 Tax=Homoserinimonas hongtaonis TaxID=2079791 RepID=UPI000D39DAC4|nr:hypothetical protein [Salinibacterium hongtaonis]AWB89585.1 hypothetical protein C2138_08555 [Salinibacterium hongtaonis]
MISVKKAIAALVLGAAVAAGPAVSATAAPGGLEVSRDGVSYSSALTGSLLTDIASMVPGDSQQGTFYVRNSSSTPGFLRIVLTDVTYSDLDLANALTVVATAGGANGAVTPISLADPCWAISEGQVVPSGGVTRVDLGAALANLDGSRGQGATASLSLGVSLSDMTPGSLAPSICGVPNLAIAVTPDATRNVAVTNPADPPASHSGDLVPGDADLPVLGLAEGLGIDPNTWHLFEEYWVLLPMGAFIVGTMVFGVVVWRRRRTDEQPENAV